MLVAVVLFFSEFSSMCGEMSDFSVLFTCFVTCNCYNKSVSLKGLYEFKEKD